MFIAVFLWLLFGIFSALIASSKGRSGFAWFLVGVFLGPFGLLVAALPAQQKQTQEAKREVKEVRVTEQKREFSTELFVKSCLSCAERIKLEAPVCRFCGHKFTPRDIQAGIQWAKKEFERKELEKTNTLTLEQKEKLSRGLCPNCDAYQAFKRDTGKNRLTCEVCKSQYPLDEEKRTQTEPEKVAAVQVSPEIKALVIINVVGIVLIGTLYWYWYGGRPSEAPLTPPPAKRVASVMEIPSEAPPKVAKPTVTPRESPKPASPPSRMEKSPNRLAKASEPKVKPEKRYRVQVASLVIERNALSLRNHLEKLGYTPVIRMTTAPITRHRVYGGEFGTREEAERTARRLNVDGFPSNLVEGEDGKFRLEVASSYNLNKAIDLAHTLREKNYTPKIDSKAVPTPVHKVRVGEYGSRAEALRALEALKRQGFTPLIMRQ